VLTRRPHPWTGAALIAIGALCWGTGGVGATIVAENSAMSSPAVSAIRLLGAGGIMLVVTAASGQLRRVRWTPLAMRHILITGALTAVFGGTYYEALSLAGVAIATVVSLGVSPVTVAIIAAVRDRRPPKVTVMVALGASLVGLCLVSGLAGGTVDVASPADTALGVVMAIVSGVAFAVATQINQRPVAGITPLTLVATSFTVAGVLSCAWGAIEGFHFASMTPTAWWGIAFLAVVQTVLGHGAFYFGLHRGVSPTTALVISLLEPITATILAFFVLHQALTVPSLVGIALLLVAMVLMRPDVGGADGGEPIAP
jgi:drug/metabolite transporter, DME family